MDWDTHLPSILAWGGSVVTGIFTLLGVWFANKNSLKQLSIKLTHESDKERNEAQRSRLEELYSLVDRWAGQVVIHHVTYRKVMEGELTYDQALDFTIQHRDNQIDAARMFTLADLYFPSAHEELQELKDLRDRAAAIQSSFKEAYKQGEITSRQHAEMLSKLLERFSVVIRNYKMALAEHATNV